MSHIIICTEWTEWATALLTAVLNNDHSNRHGNLVLIKVFTLSTKCWIHQKEKRKRETERLRSSHPSGRVPSTSYTECKVSPVCVEVNTHTETLTHIHKNAGRSCSSDHTWAQSSDWGRGKLGPLCYKTGRVRVDVSKWWMRVTREASSTNKKEVRWERLLNTGLEVPLCPGLLGNFCTTLLS